jgi:hypothetical protein
VVGEIGEEKEEEEASGRREGNTMGDGEKMFALWDEENALGGDDEEDASGVDEDATPWEEDPSSDSEARPPSSETSDREAKEAYRSPASICASKSNSNSCFTQGGQVHIHVHVTGEDVTGEDVAGLSGDGLNVVCMGLLG